MENESDKKQKDSAVREYLFLALLRLMEQKPFDKITITDIAKTAGVSRMSYYRLFQSKEDILNQYSDEVFAELLVEIRSAETLTVYEFLLLIFQMGKREEKLLRALFSAKLYEQVAHHLVEYGLCLSEQVFGLDRQDVWTDYRVYRQAGMVFLVLLRWMERGMQETPEEMAEFMEKTFI